MNPVVHFEMPFDDRDRMVKFYRDAFGWKPNMLGPEMNDYVVVDTSERDSATNFPTKPGRINGGFAHRTEDFKVPSLVVAVDDIQDGMKKVQAAGGTLHGEPVMIPGNGMYISFTDSEGNRASMIQPIGM